MRRIASGTKYGHFFMQTLYVACNYAEVWHAHRLSAATPLTGG